MALKIITDELFAQLQDLLDAGTILVPQSLVETNGVSAEDLQVRAANFEFDYPSIMVEMVDSVDHFLLQPGE